MICERCKAEGKTSNVSIVRHRSTLIGWQPYYDDVGNYHSDNPNTTTTEYRCSNGHRWAVTTNARGGFVGETSVK